MALVVIGIMTSAQFEKYEGLIDASILSIIAIVGAVMVLVTILGFFGIFKLKKILLMIYSVALFVLLLAMIILGIVFISYLNGIDKSASAKAGATASKAQEESVYKVQNYINCTYNECCDDWPLNITSAKCKLRDIPNEKVDGAACLGFADLGVNTLETCSSYDKYDAAIMSWLKTNLTPLGSAVIGIAAMQLVAFMITCAFVCTEVRAAATVGTNKYEE